MSKHILLVTDHLGHDGTGRFITYLANGLANYDDYRVSLLVFHREDRVFNKDISFRVDVIELGLKHRIRYSLPKIINRIVAISPDICIVLYTQLVYLSLLSSPIRKRGTKILFRETIIPSMYRGNGTGFAKYLCKASYRKYDRIIAQSNDMSQDMVNNWGVNKSRITVINNPISVQKIIKSITNDGCPADMQKSNRPIFLSAGRLSYQKGYDIILKRLSQMHSHIPFMYYIIGDGECKEQVSALIQEYELSDSELDIYLSGNVVNAPLEKGSYLLKYQGINVDIAKSDSRVIKNHFPKGLRITKR